MRRGLGLIGLAVLAGCSTAPSDPLRIVDSPADVFACRSLGRVSEAVKTVGEEPTFRGLPANTFIVPIPGFGTYGPAAAGDSFALRLDAMKEASLKLGATHLLLRRRVLRDWSYVEGVAYRCPVPGEGRGLSLRG